jgi:hypothetical protein
MAQATLEDSIANLVLEAWGKNQLANALFEGDPFYGIVEKDFECEGYPIPFPIMYGSDGGSSSRFSTAQTNYSSNGEERWQIPLMDEHQVFQISNKLKLTMSKGGKAAIVDGLEHVTGKAVTKLKRTMSLNWWRDETAVRGVIASGSASETLVLATPDDAIFLEIGDVIASSNTSTGTTEDAEGIKIIGVDPITGSLVKAAGTNWNAGGNFSAADFLFIQGTKGLKLSGVPAWVPSSAPSATPFYGIRRDLAPVALAGHRFTASAPTDGTLMNAYQRQATEGQRYAGAKYTDLFVAPGDWNQLAREMGSPTPVQLHPVSMDGNVMAHIGYDVLKLHTAMGHVNVHSEFRLRRGRNYMFDRKAWKIVGNRTPGLDTNDKNSVLRMGAAAALEGRLEAYLNLACKIPGHCSTGDTSAVQVGT